MSVRTIHVAERNRSYRNLRGERLESRHLLTSSPFTIAVLPDTQHYSESFPEIFDAQTNWIVANRTARNIAFVTHEGDVVQDGGQGVDNNDVQWQRADAAISKLDGSLLTDPDGLVPYAVALGNRDYSIPNDHTRADEFIEYFGDSRYAGRSWYLGSSPDQFNYAQVFAAGPFQFLHLTLEWEPRDSAITWAQGVLDSYPQLPAIVTTHSYLRQGGRSSVAETTDGRSGEQLFQDFVKPNPQIFMVLAGHVSGEYFQVSNNDAGLPVLEMTVDYQTRANGGNGFLRLLEFVPDANRIDVSTYSPWLNAFETDSNSQFSINLDFASRFDFTFPPSAVLAGSIDNGPFDANPISASVWLAGSLPDFRIQLSDIRGGIDDATVIPTVLELRRDGELLSSGIDYAFEYDAGNDHITLASSNGQFDFGRYDIRLNTGGARVKDRLGNSGLATQFSVTIGSPLTLLYFAVNAEVGLPGGGVAANEDIVVYDGSQFGVYFDGSDVGLASALIDGLALLSDTELLLSFTSPRNVAGISDVVEASDIVKFTAVQWGSDTVGTFALYFDGSDVGLDNSGENIDAMERLDDGRLLISTTGALSVAGLSGADEDLLAFSPSTLGPNTAGSWAMYFDGSNVGVGKADVDGAAHGDDGRLYLSMQDTLVIAGATVEDEDIVAFMPTTLGPGTTGSFQPALMFDGSQFGFSGVDIVDFDVQSLYSPPTFNQLPQVTLVGATAALPEDVDTTSRIAIATILVTDDGLGTNMLTLGGPDAALFEIDANVLYLKAGTALNAQLNPLLEVSVRVDDATVGVTPDDIADLVVGVLAANQPANVTLVGATAVLPEDVDTTSRIAMATVLVTDDGLGTNVVTLGGPDAALFEIDANVLYLKAGTALNVQLNPLLEVSVQVDDPTVGGTPDDSASLAVSVLAPNQPPSVTLVGTTATLRQDTDTTSRVAMATIQVTDDGLGTNLLTLGGPDAALFEIDVNVLYLRAGTALNAQLDPLLEVSVQVDDPTVGGTPDGIVSLQITITSPGEVLYFSTSAQANLPGNVVTENEDVAAYDGSQFTLFFDGSDVGLASAVLDGFTMLSDTEILLSFTSARSVAGISGTVDAADIVKFTATQWGAQTTGTFAMYLDGSDVGLDTADENIDAIERLPDGRVLISTSGNFNALGVSGSDEDLLAFTPILLGAESAGSWGIYFDGSDVGMGSSDVDGATVTTDGRLYLSFQNTVTVGGGIFEDEDVAAFVPVALGENTSGKVQPVPFFDGSQFGLGGIDVVAIDIQDVSQAVSTAVARGASSPSVAASSLSGFAGGSPAGVVLYPETDRQAKLVRPHEKVASSGTEAEKATLHRHAVAQPFSTAISPMEVDHVVSDEEFVATVLGEADNEVEALLRDVGGKR